MLATFGRAIAVSASSTVSTETPYAAMRFSSTSASSASYVASRDRTSVGRAVQLDEVERLDAEVGPRAVGPGAEGVQRVGVRDVRVGAAAHLRRDHDRAARARGALREEPPDEALAAPVAVHVGRVEERDPRVHRGVEHREGVVLAHVTPVRAQLPAPQPDDSHRASRPSQNPCLHGVDATFPPRDPPDAGGRRGAPPHVRRRRRPAGPPARARGTVPRVVRGRGVGPADLSCRPQALRGVRRPPPPARGDLQARPGRAPGAAGRPAVPRAAVLRPVGVARARPRRGAAGLGRGARAARLLLPAGGPGPDACGRWTPPSRGPPRRPAREKVAA